MQFTKRFIDPAGDIFAEFDRLFRTPLGTFQDRTEPSLPQGFSLHETEDARHLRADLPGFTKEDLDLSLKEGVLTVTAKQSDENPTSFRNDFSQSLRLPKDVATDGITASLELGVLEIRLPKEAPAQPETTRIEIN